MVHLVLNIELRIINGFYLFYYKICYSVFELTEAIPMAVKQMMFHKIFKSLFTFMLLALPLLSQGTAWKIMPGASSLTFIATQNGAPVSGDFKNFGGEINFDPAQLANSHIKINIDINSITSSYSEVASALKGPQWFDAKLYPQAHFESSSMTKTGNLTYEAKGMLTIRDKTLPATLMFKQLEYTATKAVMEGGTTIQRSAFGIGQGEWADTKTIKDDVQINFQIFAGL
jgi:polyisoprenoid-binding protein YceI